MATLDLSNLPFDPQKAREEVARRQVEYERQKAAEEAAAFHAGSKEAEAYRKKPNLANKQRYEKLGSVLADRVNLYTEEYRNYKNREVDEMVKRDRESGRRGFVKMMSIGAAIVSGGAGAALGGAALGGAGLAGGAAVGGYGGMELGKKAFDQAEDWQRKMDLGPMPNIGGLPGRDFTGIGSNPELVAAGGYGARGGDLGQTRSYETTGTMIKGESNNAFTGYEKGSLLNTGFDLGSMKLPSMQFKMPIGKVVNYEL